MKPQKAGSTKFRKYFLLKGKTFISIISGVGHLLCRGEAKVTPKNSILWCFWYSYWSWFRFGVRVLVQWFMWLMSGSFIHFLDLTRNPNCPFVLFYKTIHRMHPKIIPREACGNEVADKMIADFLEKSLKALGTSDKDTPIKTRYCVKYLNKMKLIH